MVLVELQKRQRKSDASMLPAATGNAEQGPGRAPRFPLEENVFGNNGMEIPHPRHCSPCCMFLKLCFGFQQSKEHQCSSGRKAHRLPPAHTGTQPQALLICASEEAISFEK